MRAHISTPQLCPKKITPDFAMGGPPIYESFVRKVGHILYQKIETTNQKSK